MCFIYGKIGEACTTHHLLTGFALVVLVNTQSLLPAWQELILCNSPCFMETKFMEVNGYHEVDGYQAMTVFTPIYCQLQNLKKHAKKM